MIHLHTISELALEKHCFNYERTLAVREKILYYDRGKYFSFCALKPGGTSLKNWQFGEPFLLAQSANKLLKQVRDCRKNNKEGH